MAIDPDPIQTRASRRRRFAIVAFAGLVSVVGLLAACSGSDSPEPIATNDGAILVRPPDVLEGDTGDADEAAGSEVAADADPNAVPIVAFTYFDGTPGNTGTFRGQPTVLNFWASNCPPCVAEMPEFEEVHQALGSRVGFVGMNTGDVSREAAESLAERTGVTYPLADDADSEVFRAFRGFVMPTTVFINDQGQVAYSWAGVLTADELTRLIDEHLLTE